MCVGSAGGRGPFQVYRLSIDGIVLISKLLEPLVSLQCVRWRIRCCIVQVSCAKLAMLMSQHLSRQILSAFETTTYKGVHDTLPSARCLSTYGLAVL